MQLPLSQITEWTMAFFWPFARVTGLVMVAPIFGATLVPLRIRLVVALALTAMVAPMAPAMPDVNVFSLAGVLVTAQQVLIGVAMGFALQMTFDALVIGGQAIAMSMGLGFATMVDPARGVSVPVVAQYFLIVATLVFLSLNGHIVLIDMLAQSFHTLPVGQIGLGRDGFWRLVLWGGEMFAGAVSIALPAMTALLVVNVAFGVMSRAAPTLNLFAVGFPITLGLGFVIILMSMPNFPNAFQSLLANGFGLLRSLIVPVP